MDIRVPEVGESIVEALVARWRKKDGESVRREEPVCELETDKVTLELNAEADGILSILVPEGSTVAIGTVIGSIRESGGQETAEPAPSHHHPPLSPAARKLAREKDIRPETIKGSGKKGRVLAEDLMALSPAKDPVKEPMKKPVKEPESEPAKKPETQPAAPGDAVTSQSAPERTPAPAERVQSEEAPAYQIQKGLRATRSPMSPIRKRIAERLTEARRETAMATTFNEADMGRIIALQRKYRDHFREKHGLSLGLMPFFVNACLVALKEFPSVNARIDGNDIVRQHFFDIGIAVSSEKGLVVPVLRDADRLGFDDIEREINGFVEKARTNHLEIRDLQGGTFTISNGGVFGSLLSTPLLNPPQSATLGMHAIQDRPVALLGKVVIRPMMYLALTYDHRVIDGREAVLFLKKVRECVEEPEESLLEG
ncbi:MAG: 2-oxoglutarate dehydrogenase complex dihydrolipoyllysine-residue succinyltransferase [Geobacteraceae bacterium]|nr:2-oxoglutarate dehydrogenase complex dihydrolipoyllysine-residue succinyltransferase [Geobacteraceae bacterium]